MDKVLILFLFCTGIWGIITGRTLIRKIIGLSLMNSSVVILFVLSGRSSGSSAPILSDGGNGPVVDPVPQALMLTAIVVGLSITAVALILAVRIYRACGSLDIGEIERKADDAEH